MHRNLRRGTRGVLCAVVVLFSAVYTNETRALGEASLYLGPASGTFTVGSTFTVSIYLNTSGEFVNAVEANVSFPPDKLQVVSPTAGTSLVQVWVNQPTYSNTAGTLKFQGAIPTPGINTQSGIVSTVTFRVKSIGAATIKILDSSRVLLNDGKGTDVLGNRSGAVYSLVLPPPAGPVVSSPTNSDQERWYPTKTPVFRWESAPDVTAFSFMIDDLPVSEPDDISEGLQTAVSYPNLSDGIHYFHIKALRAGPAGGGWGGTTHYIAKIDNAPPAAFKVEFSPGERTSNKRPIIAFTTTDAVSGIDHYELKIISLDPRPMDGSGEGVDTPFFIEAVSPYVPELNIGRYDVVVQAFDRAGNSFQATNRLTVTDQISEFVTSSGLRLTASYTLPWWLAGSLLLIIFASLAFLAGHAWREHHRVLRALEAGPTTHPEIAGRLEQLEQKRQEYGSLPGMKSLFLGLLIGAALFAGPIAYGAESNDKSILPVEPPIVTLFPKELSNNEIFYIGGRAGAPDAEVLIYIQNTDTGSTLSGRVATDKTGAWFYSLPQFLSAGNYVVWTQLAVGEVQSQPGPRFDLTVARTAFQFGEKRLSFERLYLTALILLFIFLVIVIGDVLYHLSHARAKRRKLMVQIREAEESIRRGFALLRRDIEAELAVVHRAKLNRELTAEEKVREEKLLHDLEFVNSYIGKEVWKIEQNI